MPKKGVLDHFWVFESVLHDKIRRHDAEGSRALRKFDATFQSSSCHCHWRVLHAVATPGRGQHRGYVASRHGLPQRD